ncbi:MAG: DUF4430 domain-containing protein [Clostridia bacterium]|nr:DUF4430 domain-containing protein [Clostridia bacterium]
MKKKFRASLAVLVSVLMLFSLVSCSGNGLSDGSIWSDATYTEDIQLGKGQKTITVEVEAEEKVVVFTVKTDKETVGEALQELELIEGEEGEYGLYVKTVNGMLADYGVNQSYWAFLINGEYASTGVDGAVIADKEIYRLVYTK